MCAPTESSSSEDSDEEGQPARKPSRKAAAAAAPVAAAPKKKKPDAAAAAAAEAAAAAAAQAQLLDMFGSFVPPAAAAPAPAPAPAAKASKKSRAPPPPVESEEEESSEESSEEEEVAPPPKKKASKKAAAAAPEPVAAAAPGARGCSVADCGQPRVKRGYCAQHLNDPSAPSTGAPRRAPAAAARGGHDDDDAPQSMASFLGDDSEEALAGFGGLAVSSKGGPAGAAGPRKIKRNPAAAAASAAPAAASGARRPAQQQQRYVDPGLDGEYDEAAGAGAGGDYYDNPPPIDDGYEDGEYPNQGAGSPQSPQLGGGPSKSYNPSAPKNAADWRIDFENTSTSLGMNKNIVVWNFVWKRVAHQVELHHSTFGGKRKVVVDGRVRVQEKKPFADQSRYDLRIGEGPLAVNVGVQIKAAGLTAFTYELYVERYPYDQAQKFWLTHPEV